tara:strand:- start:121377 stop:121901 length:525 start_codon:yes stop_codon:yes gene_type:complete
MPNSNFEKQLTELLEKEVPGDNSNTEVQEQEGSVFDNIEITPVTYDNKDSTAISSQADLLEDYKNARSNLYGLMGRTNFAIEQALKLAMLSEHPRALEVAGQLMNNSSNISKELINLHKTLKDKLDEGGEGQSNYTQVNNHYYNSDKKEIDDLERELEELDNKKEEPNNENQED